MSHRLLVIVAELAVASALVCWGVATVRYPALWRLRGARWWVGWTKKPVARAEGVGVALAGVGLVLSGAAAVMISPTGPITPNDRPLQLAGLGVLGLAGILLAIVHPTITEEADEEVPSPDVADHRCRPRPGPRPRAGRRPV